MPPQLLIDVSEIDLTQEVFSREQIAEVNPQAYEMSQLDGIIWYDEKEHLAIGYKDATENEFWIRGHIPGRPIMPGVIMVEAAAQLASFYMKKIYGLEGFIGFSGIGTTKFRGTVVPGDRLILLGKIIKFRSRQFTAQVQGFVGDSLVFDTIISGMKV